MAYFYPNECFICNVTHPLQACNQCNLICYCGKEHQTEHWFKHKEFCDVIFIIMKEKKISHIYENERGVDSLEWKRAREKMLQKVNLKLGRPLDTVEREMLLFPRVCFVCHDSRQALLKKCPRCPNATFCKEHPSSSIHDKDCLQVKECHEIDTACKNVCTVEFRKLVLSVVENTPVTLSSSQKWPMTIKEYFECVKYIQCPRTDCCQIMQKLLTEIFSEPLTIFNALKVLENSSLSTLVLLISGTSHEIEDMQVWEILFHLIPSLKYLNIIMVEFNEINNLDCNLCEKCRASEKKLSFEVYNIRYDEYLELDNRKEIDLVFLVDVLPLDGSDISQREFKIWLMSWGSVNRPLVVTTDTEKKAKFCRENLDSTFHEVLYFYDGYNDFASIRPERDRDDQSICRSNKMMMLVKIVQENRSLNCKRCRVKCQTVVSKTQNCFACESELLCNDFALFPKESENLSRDFFYVHSCQLCHLQKKDNYLVPCTYCKMIFYCDQEHRKEHWPEHKKLCQVIISMLIESGSSNLFEKSDKTSCESWMQSKINLMLIAESKIGRKLLDHEKEIFLFPKACFVCHDCNLSFLKTCKCGISFCRIHKDFPEHEELCKEFFLAAKVDAQLLPMRQWCAPICPLELMIFSSRENTLQDIPLNTTVIEMPSSMKEFIENYIQFLDAKTWEELNPKELANLRQLVYADIFSRPLTVLYVIQKFEWSFDSIVIHLIGANDDEKCEAGYWEILLHWVPNLKSLEIVFTGPKVSELQPVKIKLCKGCSERGKSLEVKGFGLIYDEYFESKFFIKPNIIVGFNLHMHESEFGISNIAWENTILTLRKMKTPFIFTSASELKAEKDRKKLEAILGESIDYDCLERNPFAGHIPRRDFETERLQFSNQFIVVYTELYKEMQRGETLKRKLDEETQSFDLQQESTPENREPKAKKIAEGLKTKNEIKRKNRKLGIEDETSQREIKNFTPRRNSRSVIRRESKVFNQVNE